MWIVIVFGLWCLVDVVLCLWMCCSNIVFCVVVLFCWLLMCVVMCCVCVLCFDVF